MKICPSCGEENPEKFRLCGFCGTALPESSAPPQEIRKTVTIVFCDLKGSTAMAERLDTESLREVLTFYFAEMRGCIERHGGTVEKYIGDAIVALFGLPDVHEDDALRGVRAAADMRTRLEALNDRLEAQWGVRLANRTGVNTGEVVAATDIGSRHRLVAGDAMNTAARLEQNAPENEILIGEPTYRLVRDAVRVEAVEPLAAKGKAEPLTAFRLIEVTRGEDGVARRQDAPMVGRTQELAQLEAALDEAVSTRTPRMVTVLAPAGTGKSRLLSEFVSRSAHRARALRGRCLSYGDGITFWPLAEIARQAAGIQDDDTLDVAIPKLAAIVAGEEGLLERLSGAIGMTEGDFPVTETFWAARRLLEIHARRGPLIIVVDDIHWAEQTLLDLLAYVVDTGDDAPFVVVCSARRDVIEDHPQWGEPRPRSSLLTLPPLSEEESALVASNLLGRANLAPEIRHRIVATAEGNPLFVEHLLGMLVDQGLLVEGEDGRWRSTRDLADLALPPSISALLVARLDRLPPDERAVVERAAVIGPTFFQGAVEDLSPDTLRPLVAGALASLARKELVVSTDSTFAGEPTFRFGHVLVRDAAYHGVLKRTRADYHERFVSWVERVGPGRGTEYDEIRGYHLEQAYLILAQLGPIDERGKGVGVRGARYLSVAGRRALARGDLHAASNLLGRAASLLPQDDRERGYLLVQAGEALTEFGEFALADSTLEAAVAHAKAIGDESVAAIGELAHLHLHYVTEAEGGEAGVVEEVERAIAELDARVDHRGLARAWRLLTYVHGTACRWGAAESAARRAMEHAALASEHRLGTGFVAILATCALYGPTPVPAAIRECEDLLVAAKGDRKAEALILRAMSQLEAMRGEFDTARDLYARSRAILEELGWRVLAALTSLVSSHVEMLAGDFAAAEAELRRDFASLEAMGEKNYISTTAGFLAEALYLQARIEEAERFATVCRDLAAEDDVSSQVAWRAVRGKVLAATERADEGVALLREALEVARRSDEPDSQGMVLLDLTEALAAAGRSDEAAGAVAEALELFDTKGDEVSTRRAGRVRERLATVHSA